ncbi:enoyl-CoA hydratase/isomerase family protein [Demequina sp. B12]|uniref:enoyl-CoA hydratase/isomerase family protein n=1 Tax=Demequina sp. B12 TaxID=2992757 RepID=UPI00237B53D0|nr:enoyl-CoA hydratase/isomerase family protein [Demequina sp. B12]MDE0573114.1 enoyl-CoA hydratase/isomerase family protein [Demequina sp. B12]
MSEPIQVERHESGIAHVIFNRPGRLNAFDFAMGAAYRDVCVELTSDATTKAIVLRGEGPAFCAGGDVVAMAGAGVRGTDVTRGAHVIHEGIAALVESEVPVVAAVHGAVAGGGVGLMLAADYVVAASTVMVAGKYADVGLTPDLGVSTLLTRAVGERRALAMLVAGVQADATKALEWGLVQEVVPDPVMRAHEVAQVWATSATAALGGAKRLVRAAPERSFRESLDQEARRIGQAYDTADARARIAAFTERATRASAGREG